MTFICYWQRLSRVRTIQSTEYKVEYNLKYFPKTCLYLTKGAIFLEMTNQNKNKKNYKNKLRFEGQAGATRDNTRIATLKKTGASMF